MHILTVVILCASRWQEVQAPTSASGISLLSQRVPGFCTLQYSDGDIAHTGLFFTERVLIFISWSGNWQCL